MTILRVTTTRGGGCPCCAVRTHARRHGDGPAAWSSCWLLRGSRPWSGTHESARVSVCAAARAPRGRPVSLVCSCSRRPGAGHRRHRGRTRSPRTSGVVRHPCRSADAGFAVGVGVGDFVLRFRADGGRRSRSRIKILLTQILYDRYSPRYSTSESYMCTTYCAHVSRNRRPLASPLPVARARASAAQERLCKPAPPPMWSSSSQPSCSRLLEMRLIPLAFGGSQIAEEVLSFFGIGNDSA